MSMQEMILANMCDSLIHRSMQWMASREIQLEMDQKELPFIPGKLAVDNFLEDCEEIFELDAYKKFETRDAFVQLAALYRKVKEYQEDPVLSMNVCKISDLHQDNKWLEIENGAVKLISGLRNFIEEIQNK